MAAPPAAVPDGCTGTGAALAALVPLVTDGAGCRGAPAEVEI
jgi:hypothetical protein